MKSIAIIPARSGSKGLKDKNIKLLNGKPLIWYSINAAIESKQFDTVMVSTDSGKYAEIASKCGAEVPFLRSEMLSTDKASSWAVVQEVLDYYKTQNQEYDSLMLLQPTSPLRVKQDIINAYLQLEVKRANAIISVTEMEHSPLWSNVLLQDNCLDNFIPQKYNVARQELPTYYRYNGAIYLVKNNLFSSILMPDSWRSVYAYVMPKIRSIDIDDEFDFLLAEEILKLTQNKANKKR